MPSTPPPPIIARQLRAIAQADALLANLENEAISRVEAATKAAFAKLILRLRGKLDDRADLLGRDRAILLVRDLIDVLNILDPANPITKALAVNFEALVSSADRTGSQLAENLIGVYDLKVESAADLSLDAVAIVASEGYDRLLQHGQTFASNASIIIQQSVMLGWGVQKTANYLRASLDTTRNSAETIVRTETMRAAVGATKARFAVNGIEQVIWIATQDRRTCPYCADRAGKIYKMADIVMPLHPRDRCFLTPYRTEWEDAGLVDREWMDSHSRSAIALAGGSNSKPTKWETAGKPPQIL